MRNSTHDDATNITITFHRNTERGTCNYSHSLTSKAACLACIDLCFLAFRRRGSNQTRFQTTTSQTSTRLLFDFSASVLNLRGGRDFHSWLLSGWLLSARVRITSGYVYARTDPSRFSSFDQLPLVFTLSSSTVAERWELLDSLGSFLLSSKNFRNVSSLKLLFRSIFHILLFTLVLPFFPRVVHVSLITFLSFLVQMSFEVETREFARF